MNRLIICLTAIALTLTAKAGENRIRPIASAETVIPAPTCYTNGSGTLLLARSGATFYATKGLSAEFKNYIESLPLNISLSEKKSSDVVIDINSEHNFSSESYRIEINKKGIRISSSSETGAFYAFQTLLQMTEYGKIRELQVCRIEDSPRFTYRGLMFDVSRHFRSKEFLIKQMDAMALIKLNRMHLHLTDGAGWRIEIKGYPLLTEYAAWRPQKRWTDWVENGAKLCDRSQMGAYGGYYTAEDIREILDSAAKRHIEVIPEIEMPGHSDEVIATYPELGCSGIRSGDFCPGKETTFSFLEDVLTQVMEMFPSEYIHIGGDEAGKNAWKSCPDCQKRMREEGLADVDELQSYLIHRIEKFINSKGRKMIGWDEILEGGIAPNATVMSWRGIEGGIKAAKSGHDVIMTPGSHCYLDYSQDAPFKEPVSIGGYTPLEKTYSYEPLDWELSDKKSADWELSEEDAEHIIGIQGNLWTEYVTDDSHAEYMYYPRAFAIAETGWSQRRTKNYGEFKERAIVLCKLLDSKGFNTFDIENEYGERKESLSPLDHKGKGKKVTYSIPYSPKYEAAGVTTLTDGIAGGWTYGDKKWQGFNGDMDVTIDMGEMMPIKYIGATFMHSHGAWVHVPDKVEFLISEDGKSFKSVGSAYCDIPTDAPKILFKSYSAICQENARFIRIKATGNTRPGAWLFTDEIIVN